MHALDALVMSCPFQATVQKSPTTQYQQFNQIKMSLILSLIILFIRHLRTLLSFNFIFYVHHVWISENLELEVKLVSYSFQNE